MIVKVLLLLNYLTVYKRKTEPSKYELQYRSGENRDDVSLSTVLACADLEGGLGGSTTTTTTPGKLK